MALWDKCTHLAHIWIVNDFRVSGGVVIPFRHFVRLKRK